MSTFKHLFGLRREERWIALGVFLILAALSAMMIYQYSPLFLKGGHLGFWSIFEKNFRMSGYDCWSYITISNMRVHFETARHPLFLTVLYPFYLLNHWLMGLTGINFAVFFMAALITVCSVYSIIFIYRTLKNLIGLSIADALLLTVLFFSFGHVMVTMIVPDHFGISLMLLTLTMYYVGEIMKNGEMLRWWQTAVLLFFTAGITVTNGAKTVIASLFANRKKFFTFRNILLGIILPSLILGGIWKWQYQVVEVPQKRIVAKIEKAAKAKNPEGVKERKKKRRAWLKTHKGRPINNKEFFNLTDVTTPRSTTIVENFFGEPIQLHKDYLLQDLSFTRPMIVKYSSAFNYVVEALIVLLLAMSLIAGRRSRLMLMLMSWWAVDIVVHLVLGFGINEVYIMSADWIFIIPIALGTLMSKLAERPRIVFRVITAVLAVYLLCWNGSLLISYLQTPMSLMAK